MRLLGTGSIAIALVMLSLPAFAADAPKKELTPQQQKMASCNADAKAKSLKGDARKQFMSECLGSKPAGAPKTTAQQDKMKTCNKQATDQKLKGDARKGFMSTCLKG